MAFLRAAFLIGQKLAGVRPEAAWLNMRSRSASRHGDAALGASMPVVIACPARKGRMASLYAVADAETEPTKVTCRGGQLCTPLRGAARAPVGSGTNCTAPKCG